jgi:hypothetical protein
VAEPGLWFQYDLGDGPVVDGVKAVLFCAWLAWCRFRVVLAIRDKTLPTVVACIDQSLRRFGGCPTYALTDNEKTVTVDHVARIPIRNPEMVAAARHYGLTVVTCMPADPASCDGVLTTMDVVGNADMLDYMYTDRYRPALISTTYESYTPDQISLAGQAQAQGLQVGLPSVALTDPNPAVQLYQNELASYDPGQAPSEFGLEAWADAQLFVYALIESGHNPTRASLTNTLASVTNWTVDGAFGPYTPSARTGPLCVVNVAVQGSSFEPLWPSSGLYCNGQLVDVGPES